MCQSLTIPYREYKGSTMVTQHRLGNEVVSNWSYSLCIPDNVYLTILLTISELCKMKRGEEQLRSKDAMQK